MAALKADSDDNDFGFQSAEVLKLSPAKDDKVSILEFQEVKAAAQKIGEFEQKGVTALMVDGNLISTEKFCGGDLRKVLFLVGWAHGKGYRGMGPCANVDSEYYFACKADDESGDEGAAGEEGKAGEEEGEDDSPWYLLWMNGEVKQVDLKKSEEANRRFGRKAGRGRTILLVNGGGIKHYSGDGDAGGAWDDKFSKELPFLVGFASGKGLASDLGTLGDGGPRSIFSKDEGGDDDGTD